MSLQPQPDWLTYKEKASTNNVCVIGLTGASRCGKSLLACWLRQHNTAKIKVISQDTFFKAPKHMPKVALQGAPFIKVAFWDYAQSVDWTAMINEVKRAINDGVASGGKSEVIIIEGNMLVQCEWLIGVMWNVFCLDVDKWTCFERRADTATKRQHYLPYLEEMWEAHCERFRTALLRYEDGFHFIYPDAWRDTVSRLGNTVVHEPRMYVAETLSRMMAKGVEPERQFMQNLTLVGRSLPPGMSSIEVEDDTSFFGKMLPNDDRVVMNTLMAVYLGVALGDASGAPFEFNRGEPVRWHGRMSVPLVMSGLGGVRAAPPGAVTDDFQMTMAALHTLTDNNFVFNRRAHIQAYINWASKHPGGIGHNTRELFQHSITVNRELPMRKYEAKFAAKHAPGATLSMTNGTLMRASAFVSIPDRNQAIRAAVGDASISNNNSENRLANAVYVGVLHDLVYDTTGGNVHRILTCDDAYYERIFQVARFAEQDDGNGDHAFVKVMGVVTNALCVFGDREADAAHPLNMAPLINTAERKGYVLVALWVAFRWLSECAKGVKTFGQLVREIVELGGDTDTNSAIAGALMAAKIGLYRLRVSERDNLDAVLNCIYRYSTLKVLDGLRPCNLSDVLAQRYGAIGRRTAEMEETANNALTFASTYLPSSTMPASTTKKRKTKQVKQNDDDDDNDAYDDETESLDVEELRAARKASLTTANPE